MKNEFRFWLTLMWLNLKRDEYRREAVMSATNDWVSYKPVVYERRVIGWEDID